MSPRLFAKTRYYQLLQLEQNVLQIVGFRGYYLLDGNPVQQRAREWELFSDRRMVRSNS
jgi:hypothetical protein